MFRHTGRYERTRSGDEEVYAFIPAPLPPQNPVLVVEGSLEALLRKAEHALARLELAGEMVPSLSWFLYGFVRKEAVLSSQIEGTQATLVDLFAFEAQGHAEQQEKEADVQEICNYLEALDYARTQIAHVQGLPLSLRLLHETHQRLMKGVRGVNKQPGELRRSQNWIGGTRPGNAVYVPPPVHALADCLGALEQYIHQEPSEMPALIRIGLVHVQFETIHPYLDGNGRMGRLLISLLLEHWQLLSKPLLYLSLYLKRHRDEYYTRLTAVRTTGDWEGWLVFFLEGVLTIAEETVETARTLFSLVSRDRTRIAGKKESTASTMRLFEWLPTHPIVTVASAAQFLETSKPTTARAIQQLQAIGVLQERSGRKRDQLFTYTEYLDQLRTGTEPTDTNTH